jgi:hypothetical protein
MITVGGIVCLRYQATNPASLAETKERCAREGKLDD